MTIESLKAALAENIQNYETMIANGCEDADRLQRVVDSYRQDLADLEKM